MSRSFKEIERATGIYIEIIERPCCREIVARLSRCMNNERRAKGIDQRIDFKPVSYVDFVMSEVFVLGQ